MRRIMRGFAVSNKQKKPGVHGWDHGEKPGKHWEDDMKINRTSEESVSDIMVTYYINCCYYYNNMISM